MTSQHAVLLGKVEVICRIVRQDFAFGQSLGIVLIQTMIKRNLECFLFAASVWNLSNEKSQAFRATAALYCGHFINKLHATVPKM